MEFDFCPPHFLSADLWGFAIRKAICCAINLKKNIVFRIASRIWKPRVITHDINMSNCVENVENMVLLYLHVYVCDRVNLCTQLKTACCMYGMRHYYLSKV